MLLIIFKDCYPFSSVVSLKTFAKVIDYWNSSVIDLRTNGHLNFLVSRTGPVTPVFYLSKVLSKKGSFKKSLFSNLLMYL